MILKTAYSQKISYERWGDWKLDNQFISVTQSCLTLCDPMDCGTPGFPVHHHLLELAQTHVHRHESWHLIINKIHCNMVGMNLTVKVKSLSLVQLCDPMDCSLPGSSVHRIFQARVLEWVAIPFSRKSFFFFPGNLNTSIITLTWLSKKCMYSFLPAQCIHHCT